MRLVFKHLFSITMIFCLVYITVIYFAKNKKDYSTLFLQYKITCHQLDFFYELIGSKLLNDHEVSVDYFLVHNLYYQEIIKNYKNQNDNADSLDKVIVSTLNSQQCFDHYTTNRTSFIGSKSSLELLIYKINEDEIHNILIENIKNELKIYNQLLNTMNTSNISEIYFTVKKKKLLNMIKEREHYLNKKTFFVLDKKIVPKIENYDLKLSLSTTLMIYFMSLFIIFLFRNKSLGFYFK